MENTKKTPCEDGANDETLTKIKSQNHSTKQIAANQSNNDFQLIGINDLLTEPEPLEWLVDDYILQGTQVQLVGASGLGKTFLIIDLALSVITGKKWNSRDVKQGPVAYINAEGHTGFQHRIKGWSVKHQPLEDMAFCVSNGPVDMMDKSSIKNLQKHLDSFALKHDGCIAMIVIDTLRRNMSGNEDDSKDVSIFMNNFEYLCKKYGATGFVIHHPGHNNASRARGSSSQKAALDTALLLKKDKDEIGLICTKLKDGGAIPAPAGYELEVITIPWLDSKGNKITTCVPKYDKDTNVGNPALKPIPEMIDMAISTLNSSFNGIFASEASLADWESKFSVERLIKNPKAKQNTIDKAFTRAKNKLIDESIVIKNDAGNYQFSKDIDPPWAGMKRHLTKDHFKPPSKKKSKD
jgi:putative DNA primase/helicase